MGSRISVMQFTNTVVRGGVEEHILVLLRGLSRDLFKISFVCPPQLAEQVRADVPGDVELIEFEPFSIFDLGAARHFKSILTNRRIQLLHSHMFQSSRVSSPIARIAGVSAIIETPHVRESWRNRWPRSSFAPDRLVGRFVDRYIAISHANADYLEQEKKLPAAKIRVVQNSCDMRRFLELRPPRPELRRELGVGNNDPLLLVVARLEPQKGHRVMLEAMPSLVRQWPNLRVVCIGDGVLKPLLQERAATLGVAPNVFFVGFRADVPEWITMADFCVLPSLYEGLPLVAIECLAAKRTMVATAVDGTPEVIQHGRTGLLVPPNAPSALAEQIARLLKDKALRDRLAEEGRKFVFEHFREERQIRETEDVYLDVCRERMLACDLPQIASSSQEHKTVGSPV